MTFTHRTVTDDIELLPVDGIVGMVLLVAFLVISWMRTARRR